MKLIAMLERSAKGQTWIETKIFDSSTKIIELWKWALAFDWPLTIDETTTEHELSCTLQANLTIQYLNPENPQHETK